MRTLKAPYEKAWIMKKLNGISKVFNMTKTEADVYKEEMVILHGPNQSLFAPPRHMC